MAKMPRGTIDLRPFQEFSLRVQRQMAPREFSQALRSVLRHNPMVVVPTCTSKVDGRHCYVVDLESPVYSSLIFSLS